MGVKSVLIESMIDALTDEFALDDDVGVIKAGPLHDDPTRKEKSITIREVDPLSLKLRDEDWMDRRYANIPEGERTFGLSDEIGGNKAWYLRTVVELNINYARNRQDRPDAFLDADTIKDRCIDTLDGGDIYFLEGRWIVYTNFVKKIQVLEQGGNGSWQWRYALYCQAPAMHLAND